MNRFYPLSLIFLLLSCIKANNEINEETPDVIHIVGEQNITFLNRPAKLFQLSIQEEDMPLRFVEVRALKNANNPRGALILTAGGFARTFYGSGPETNSTINHAFNLGLEVFEIRWEGENGWGTDTEGAGYPKAVRAVKDIVIWLKKNQIQNPSTIIAHGGSGGAFQIAYGLAMYDLEKEIDYAIMVAGPPTADLNRAIYGDLDDEVRWPDGLGGFRITDHIHGWFDNGDYARKRNTAPPAFVTETLDKSSLLSKNEARDFSYRTKVFFVNTDDVTNADSQGKIYFEAITSEKEWHYLPDETSHNVSGIPAGAEKIRDILKRIVNKD
jgi:hypothetical protein